MEFSGFVIALESRREVNGSLTGSRSIAPRPLTPPAPHEDYTSVNG